MAGAIGNPSNLSSALQTAGAALTIAVVVCVRRLTPPPICLLPGAHVSVLTAGLVKRSVLAIASA